MTKKIRNRIELNRTNKSICGQLDILCSDYRELEQQYKKVKYDLDLVKENIKGYVLEDADYFTTKYKLVVTIQPEKTEFKYNIKKILEAYPEIKENKLFGDFKTKAEVKSLKSVEGI